VVGLVGGARGGGPALLRAALLLGFGYGPPPPAGSRILAATAPPAHRTLIFSIKQAGAPAGGALAGLLVAPLAARFGWQPALALAMAVGVLSALLIAPLRAVMDSERDPQRSIRPRDVLHIRTLRAPLDALRSSPQMVSLTALAMSFAVVQGCLFSFSVTYLTQRGPGLQGLSLAEAGFAYACMQGAGVFARVFLGWFADRTGKPAHNLVAQAYVAAVAVAGYGFFMPADIGLPLVALLAGAAGFFGCSWNGITLAEVARLSRPERVADATSGSTMFIFLGYVAGPSLFAAAVPLLGWHLPFLLAGAQLAAMAVVQSVILWRRGPAGT
jgi:MFS family permease